MSAPLHGSVTRQIHASVLKKRRQALGLEPTPMTLDLPGTLDPKAKEERELQGGIVLVGRASLKEYLEGLRRGWTGGVGGWEWEKEVEGKLEGDGVFDNPKSDFLPDEEATTTPPASHASSSPPPPPSASPLPSGLSFLSRPPPPPSLANPLSHSRSPEEIPSHFHAPPLPLPPQPPIFLLPFTNHVGFKQFPYIIYDFFTEHHRVRSGAQAALALLEGNTRPFTDRDKGFGEESETWYTKSFAQLPERMAIARRDYYSALEPRLESARALANGERELSEAEKKSTRSPVTEVDLRLERRNRELRWLGNDRQRGQARRMGRIFRWLVEGLRNIGTE